MLGSRFPRDVGLVVVFFLSAGCTRPGGTTILRISDFEVTMDKMVNSLAGSEFLVQRNPQSPRITIMIERVENLTSDVISLSDQWMLVARVRDSLPMQELAQNRNVYFVITPERHAMLRHAGYTGEFAGTYQTPTHLMSAVFESVRRSGRIGKGAQANVRTDYYFLRYAIEHIDAHTIEWTDRFEFKRKSTGTVID